MSIERVSRELSQIAARLAKAPDAEQVSINQKDSNLIITQDPGTWEGRLRRTVLSITQDITSIFGKTVYIPTIQAKDTKETCTYFTTLFGENRLKRAEKQFGLNLKAKLNGEEPFTKEDIEKIFVSSAEIYWEDLTQLFSKIKDSHASTILYLTKEETKILRTTFTSHSDIGTCSKIEIDALIKILRPFATEVDIFLGNPPEKPGILTPFFESALMEAKKRLLAFERMQQFDVKDPNWPFYLAKEISGRNPPQGVLISHKDGYFENFGKIQRSGQCAFLLKSRVSKNISNYLLYRGTSFSEFEAIQEILNPEIGAQGPLTTYEDMHEYLHNVSRGFITDTNEQVSAVGMSLGGVHAMRAAILFPSKITRIWSVCSPGLDSAAADLYRPMLQKATQVAHIFEADDHIDEFGDVRIGLGCKPQQSIVNVYLVGNERQKLTKLLRERCSGTIRKVLAVCHSIAFRRHLRPAIGRKLEFFTLTNKYPEDMVKLNKFLCHEDPTWEEIRKLLYKKVKRVFARPKGEVSFLTFAKL